MELATQGLIAFATTLVFGWLIWLTIKRIDSTHAEHLQQLERVRAENAQDHIANANLVRGVGDKVTSLREWQLVHDEQHRSRSRWKR